MTSFLSLAIVLFLFFLQSFLYEAGFMILQKEDGAVRSCCGQLGLVSGGGIRR